MALTFPAFRWGDDERRHRERWRRIVLIAVVTKPNGDTTVRHMPVWVERRPRHLAEVPIRHAR